jgi:two-component system chemotaxis response regulator CheB
MSRSIRVVIIDDSPLMRHLLTDAIGNSAGFEVVGAAHNAEDAWVKIQAAGPDVVTLDVDMPGMDGVTFLEHLMRMRPLPVVMISGLTQFGSSTTIRALQAGALDFVGKPSGGASGVGDEWIAELIAKLRRAAQLKPPAASPPRGLPVEDREVFGGRPEASVRKCDAEVIAIGSGTGGVESLRTLLMMLPPACPPVVVVHEFSDVMGVAFVEYARRNCAVRLKLAKDGDLLTRGLALFCPERSTSCIERHGKELRIRTAADAKVGMCRIDRIFETAALSAANRATAILLDSASLDGTLGLRQIQVMGGQAIVQRRDKLNTLHVGPQGVVPPDGEPSRNLEAMSLFLEQIVPAIFGGAISSRLVAK